MIVEGAMDQCAFEAFEDQLIILRLQLGQVVNWYCAVICTRLNPRSPTAAQPHCSFT